MMNILEIENLNTKIGTFELSIPMLNIAKGDIFKITGKNGSGKTVFLNTLLGYMNYAGTLRIYTQSINGFINNDTLIPYLYPDEYFRFLGRIYNNKNIMDNAQKYAKKLNFDIKVKNYIRNLSEGNKKKVGIISILSLNSEIMIFDEPFANLDSESVSALEIIFGKKEQEKTIIYTSHAKDESILPSNSYEIL